MEETQEIKPEASNKKKLIGLSILMVGGLLLILALTKKKTSKQDFVFYINGEKEPLKKIIKKVKTSEKKKKTPITPIGDNDNDEGDELPDELSIDDSAED